MILANPNTFNYYRRGQVFIGLAGKVDDRSFDYYRRGQMIRPMVLINRAVSRNILRAGMVIPSR